ncbi:MAG: hypothetical protein HQ483_17255 [Rhodospirillales bacterium]|nr:hypothetical protein [Rhodospirillales bacterium]
MFYDLLDNVGLLALLTIVFSLLHFSNIVVRNTLPSKILIGVIFGLAAAVVMSHPIVLPQGATFDTRGGPAILVAIYGSPLSAVIAAIIGAIVRLQVGGPSAIGGASSFVFYAAAGLIAARILWRDGKRPNNTTFVLVAIFGTICVLPAFFIGQSVETALAILQKAWWILLVGNIAGVLILGFMLEMNFRRNKEAEDLEKAMQKAEAANQAKLDFLSSISHELRTPMNAILGFTEFLAHNPNEPLTRQQKQSVDLVLMSGNHLLQLIDAMLDLSKIEEGKLRVTLQPISMRDVIDDCLHQMENEAKKHDIEIIDTTSETDLAFVWSDKTRLAQVLANLLSNAIKYNQPGGTVTVSCQQMPSQFLRINIADTGTGIPEDMQDHLFVPFDRLGQEAGTIEGTGIGLTLCKRIVEVLGGAIGFKSEERKGSTFWIELPTRENQVVEITRKQPGQL